jgi:hypothetical protein
MHHRVLARLALFATLSLMACSHAQPPPKESAPPPVSHKPPPPEGPTRTDFKTIADKLVSRCIGGGWISRWRSTQKDIDVARPRIFLRGFEDKTDQNLDPSYLATELERRMRMSGAFDMVPEGQETDFIAQGKILRLAERAGKGRISVYTATLDLIDPSTNKKAYDCEATVQGEL